MEINEELIDPQERIKNMSYDELMNIFLAHERERTAILIRGHELHKKKIIK